MATWGQILGEIQNALPSQGGNAFNLTKKSTSFGGGDDL